VYHENDQREERYRRLENNVWEPRAPASEDAVDRGVEMKVVATFKDPPLLIATDTKTRKSRTVLDPNPQLKGIAIGEPELYSWQDRARRNWQGILPAAPKRSEGGWQQHELFQDAVNFCQWSNCNRNCRNETK